MVLNRPTAATLMFVLAAVLGLNACSDAEPPRQARGSQKAGVSPGGDNPKSSPPDRESEEVLAKVIDSEFRPGELRVAAGATVRWIQTGDQPHSVSAVDGSFDSSPDCGPLDSDNCLGRGDRFQYVFVKPGTYEYFCRVHGLPDGTGMVGTVVVQ